MMLNRIAKAFRAILKLGVKVGTVTTGIENFNMMIDHVCPKCKAEGVTFNQGESAGVNANFLCDKNGCILNFNQMSREVEVV